MKNCVLNSIPKWKYPVEVSYNGDRRVVDPNHSHDFLQIFHINDGNCFHCIDDYSTTLHPHAVSILPAGYPHYTDARFEYIDLHLFNLTDRLFVDSPDNPRSFTSLCIKPLSRTVFKKTPIIYPRAEATEKLTELFKESNNLLKNHSVDKLPLVRGKTIELMTLIAGEYMSLEGRLYGSNMSDYCPSLYIAFSYIHNNYTDQNLSAEEVAQASMMSVRSFHRIFKEIMGMTFMQYIRYLRIRNAKQLLADTDRLLADVASASGFLDLTTFHRIFRTHIGLTPREYRLFVRNKLCAYPKQKLI